MLYFKKLFSMVYGLFKPCWLTHITYAYFKEPALLLNVHLNCFVDFVLCPTDTYMFKVNNKKFRLTCCMCSKINTAWHRSLVFNYWLWPQFNFEQVFVSRLWKTSHNVLKTLKTIYLFRNKSCKTYFIQWRLSLHRIEINYKHMTIMYEQIMNILWTYVSAQNLFQESQTYSYRFAPLFDLLYHRNFPDI